MRRNDFASFAPEVQRAILAASPEARAHVRRKRYTARAADAARAAAREATRQARRTYAAPPPFDLFAVVMVFLAVSFLAFWFILVLV